MIELLSMLAGAFLSLLFSYVPGLRAWHDKQSPEMKRTVMLAALVAVALTIFGLTCGKLYDFGIACDRAGTIELVKAFLFALVANQAAFSLGKIPVKNGLKQQNESP